MSSAAVPIKFVIGARKLFAVPRLLDTVAFGLDALVSGEAPAIPPPGAGSEGLRVLSAPAAARDAIRARFPHHVMGGLQVYDRYYIEMAGRSYADYLAGFSSKTRATLQRKRRRLAGLDIREFHREHEVAAFMADAVPLARRAYQSRSLDAGLPDDAAAVAEMTGRARRDAMRAYVLYLDGRAASYLYLPVDAGIVSYAHLGYDPAHAHLSVGTVLQMAVVERLFAEGRYRYFDFTEGGGAHKRMFGTASVPACSFLLLRPSVSNRLLLSSLDAFDSGVSIARGLAERGGALARLRRALRG